MAKFLWAHSGLNKRRGSACYSPAMCPDEAGAKSPSPQVPGREPGGRPAPHWLIHTHTRTHTYFPLVLPLILRSPLPLSPLCTSSLSFSFSLSSPPSSLSLLLFLLSSFISQGLFWSFLSLSLPFLPLCLHPVPILTSTVPSNVHPSMALHPYLHIHFYLLHCTFTAPFLCLELFRCTNATVSQPPAVFRVPPTF